MTRAVVLALIALAAAPAAARAARPPQPLRKTIAVRVIEFALLQDVFAQAWVYGTNTTDTTAHVYGCTHLSPRRVRCGYEVSTTTAYGLTYVRSYGNALAIRHGQNVKVLLGIDIALRSGPR